MSHEDFDVDSLAAYLHLRPEQVKKMAERNRLPGRRVGKQWKFSRAEIHQWFEDRIGLSDEQELNEVEKVLTRQEAKTQVEAWSITDLLQLDCVWVPMLARTKTSVIQKICEETAKTGRLWDPERMAEALRNREALHPTALGNGVALLHPRRPIPSIMGEPFLALGVTTKGIPFGGPRGCLTDIFFLIGSTDESLHLRVLARLSRLIQQAELLEILREAECSESAWQAIKDFDNNLE
jgi:PTS system nitrogen regulatory IIA component